MTKLRTFAFLSAWVFTITFAGFLPSQIVAQKPAPAMAGNAAQTLSLKSKLMGRDMPYRIILPKDYSVKVELRYPVIYLLHGLTGHYTNWTDKTKVGEYSLAHQFIIVTPEGDNGWYVDSVAKATDKYESYIMQELIPEIDAKFRTLAKTNQWSAAWFW